jgi:hypothetical protein
MFDESVTYINELERLKKFIRTPRDYGFITMSITSKKNSGLISIISILEE